MTVQAQLTTSELAQSILSFKGKKFSLNGYRPFKEVYDLDPPELTLKCSRQIGKSVSIGAILTSKSVARPYFNSLFVAPLSQQTSRFSTMYLGPFFDSPLVKKHYTDNTSKLNVFEKSLSNGSRIFLSYAADETDADRIRGIAADSQSNDEVQDISLDALYIIKETLSASDWGYIRNYGTPKSSLNTLEVLFKRGNGCEWVVQCPHCNHYNIPWELDNCIAICDHPEGPICEKCKKRIDTSKGRWLAARPDIKDHYSFHIPRFVLESRLDQRKWNDIQKSIKNYPPSKLANEVFGLAAGVAGRILSQKEVMACCNSSKTSFDTAWPMDYRGITNVVMGVDWSVTGGIASYTVISILGYDYMGKCYLLHTEKLQGIDILEQVARVEILARQFNVQLIGSDRGVGVLQGQLLKRSLGDDKVVMVQYCAAKTPLRYERVGQYMAADRTMAMDMSILKMKLGIDKFETPCWELMAQYWVDALAVYEEESLSGRRLYRKDEGVPDDWLHSVVFGQVAYMMVTGQFTYVDNVDPNQDN